MIDNLSQIGDGSFALGVIFAAFGVIGGYQVLRLVLDFSKGKSETWGNPAYWKFILHAAFRKLK